MIINTFNFNDLNKMTNTFGRYMLLAMTSITLIFALGSCKKKKKESRTAGTIHISVDPNFEPVMKQQIFVYQSSFKDAHIIASYKPEAECLHDLASGAANMIVISRGLSSAEEESYSEGLGVHLPNDIMAWDAVCVVVNRNSNDTLFTRKSLAKLLSSQEASDIPLVMDGDRATSTVRFLMDSVIDGQDFGKNVVSVNGANEVLSYLKTNPNAIGFIGSSWLDNNNKNQQEAMQYVKPAYLLCERCKEDSGYYQPSQATINNMHYPFFRPLYAISRENSMGLTRDFYNFLTLERGQLVFKVAGLDPAIMQFNMRSVNLKSK